MKKNQKQLKINLITRRRMDIKFLYILKGKYFGELPTELNK